MGTGADAAATKGEQSVPDERKAKLEGLIVQSGPPAQTKDEPSATTPTTTPDSDLPKVKRDPGV